MSSRLRRWGVLTLMGSLLLTSIQGAAYATVITTGEYLGAMDRQSALARVEAVLAREEVRGHLEQLGVAPEDAARRVHSLTDAELALLAERLESLPAGGDLLGVIGVVFIVLLILELVGVTDVFSRI